MRSHGPDHVLGQQVVEQHHARPGVERGRQLAEAGIEGQGQRRQQHIALAILDVGGDALGAGDHVAMGQHHAFGLARAAGGIEDADRVRVDHAMPAARRRVEHLAPAVHRGPDAGKRRRGGCADDDHMGQLRAASQHLCERLQPLARCDQDADAAVTQDVGHLLRLEQRVDGNEYRSVRRRSERCTHRLAALVEIDGDPLAPSNSQRRQRARKSLDLAGQFVVADTR